MPTTRVCTGFVGLSCLVLLLSVFQASVGLAQANLDLSVLREAFGRVRGVADRSVGFIHPLRNGA
jgi:hypothetical protein